IVENKVALRAAGQLRRRDGTIKNLSGGPDFNDIDQHAFRASLLVEPVEGLSNTLIYDYFEANEQPAGNTLIGINPSALGPIAPFYSASIQSYFAQQQAAGPHKVFSELDNPHLDRKSWGLINTTSWDITDNLLLKNIVSFRRASQSTQINTAAVGTLESATLGGQNLGPMIAFYASSVSQREYLTEELQLQGKSFDGAVDWDVGGFFNRDRSDGPMGSQFEPFDLVNDGRNLTFSSLHTRNYNNARFGQTGIDLSDLVTQGLKLNLGYRYTWDKVSVCGGGNNTHYISDAECRDIASRGLPDGTGVAKAKGSEGTY